MNRPSTVLAMLVGLASSAAAQVDELAVSIEGRTATLTWIGLPTDPAASPFAAYRLGISTEPIVMMADTIPVDVPIYTDPDNPSSYFAVFDVELWDTTYYFAVEYAYALFFAWVSGTTGPEVDTIPP